VRTRTRYLVVLAITCAVTLILVGLVNMVIDPYGTYRFFDIPGVNRKKPYPDHDIGKIKTNAMPLVNPDALILGNSRAEVGFDPTNPLWSEHGYHSVYNAAVPGSGIGVAWGQLLTCAANSKPKAVFLGLDFFDFLVSPNEAIEPLPTSSTKVRADSLRWRMQTTLTMQSLIDSLTTLRIQRAPYSAQLTDRGFNPLREYIEFARSEGYYKLFRQRAEENAKKHSRRTANIFAQGTQTSADFEGLRQMVRWALKNDVELRLIIYPYHAQLLIMIDELGLWQSFEDWKRQLVRIIAEETDKHHSPANITLLDFSGFSSYAREKIPAKGDRTTVVKWYWEAGHFKKELGDIVITRSLTRDLTEDINVFGIQLTQDTIDLHLARTRSEKFAFKHEQQRMVEELVDLIDNARVQGNN